MTTDKQVAATLLSLKRSAFRAKFKLSAKDRLYLHDKGIDTIRNHAVDFLTKRVAPALPGNDGKQTPMKNHPVFIAQHATATCCRSCILKWHRIPKGRALDKPEIACLVDLIMGWIMQQTERPD